MAQNIMAAALNGYKQTNEHLQAKLYLNITGHAPFPDKKY